MTDAGGELPKPQKPTPERSNPSPSSDFSTGTAINKRAIRSREAIAVDKKQIGADVDEVIAETSRMGEKFPGKERDIQAIVQSFTAEDSQIEAAIAALHLSDADSAAVKILRARFVDIGNRDLRLLEEEKPYAIEDLAQSIEKLHPKVDYSALRKVSLDLEDRSLNETTEFFRDVIIPLAELEGLKNELATGTIADKSAEEIQRITRQVNFLKSTLEQKKLLKTEYVEDSASHGSQQAEEDISIQETVEEELNVAIKQVGNFEALASTYKRIYLEDNFDIFLYLKKLNNLIPHRELSSIVQGNIFDNNQLLQVIQISLGKAVTKFRESVQIHQTSSEEQDLQSYTLEGLGMPTNGKYVYTDDELRQDLTERHLDPFLKGTSIKFEEGKIKSIDNDHPDLRMGGEYIAPNQGDLPSPKGEIRVYAGISLPLESREVESVRLKLVELIAHEGGHHVHTMLSYEQLEKWEDITTDDKTPVDGYVTFSRGIDSACGKREDFAESFRLFATDPTKLFLLSEKRFEYMKRLFISKFSPEEARVLTDSLDNQMGQINQLYPTPDDRRRARELLLAAQVLMS